MKFATTISLFIAATAVNAVSIPKEHHSRFLKERESLIDELADWKDSPAGEAARENGFYTESNSLMSEDVINDQLVRFFNSKLAAEDASRLNHGARYGVKSPFTLMTNEEFKEYVARSFHGENNLRKGATAVHKMTGRDLESLPESVDHSTGSCIGPVMEQRECGACWAITAIAAIEHAVCQATGKLELLSVQQIVSCAHSSPRGCAGGHAIDGIKYATSHGAICTAESYPYESGESGDPAFGSCSTNQRRCKKVRFKVKATKVENSERAYMSALVDQPLSITVAAGNPSWKQYEGGIVRSCSSTRLDHSVYAVGYDATSFKLKNSWGTAWGENGFIRLARIDASTAACDMINESAVYASITK